MHTTRPRPPSEPMNLLNSLAKNVWGPEQLAGLSPSMAAEFSRLNPVRKGFGQIKAGLAQAYEDRELSAGPVRAVLGASFQDCPLGILVVTDLDVLAVGQGYGEGQDYESTIIAKEWISEYAFAGTIVGRLGSCSTITASKRSRADIRGRVGNRRRSRAVEAGRT